MIKFITSKVVNISELQPNDYNPNRMAKTEMNLLKESISKYGFIFPIVTTWDSEISKYRIIDGYHRYQTLINLKSENALIVDLEISYADCVKLTVLMNRIKGMHKVEKMSDLVIKLQDLGIEDFEIAKELGMEVEELLRLKQQLGIASMFANKEFSKSWEV